MKADEFSSHSVLDLLQLHSQIIEELKRRGVLRTKNNPVGDYAEWLTSKALGLKLESNSVAGYDATDDQGIRYQIKARRVTPDNSSRQLSAIRNLESQDFDFIIGVIFYTNYDVMGAYIVPHEVVQEYATYRKHVNAHILHLRGNVLRDAQVKDITGKMQRQTELFKETE